MSKFEKLKLKILNGKNVSFDDAECLLSHLGFNVQVRGSHHVFRKKGYPKTVSIKRRSQLIAYQIEDLQEVIKHHDK